jgi:hypothetical protein
VGTLGCGHGERGIIPYLNPGFKITTDINAIPVAARFPARSTERTVVVLLAHGAAPRAKNTYGRTPLDMARANAAQVLAESAVVGVEDGAILHDPPWNILLPPPGASLDWGPVVEALAKATNNVAATTVTAGPTVLGAGGPAGVSARPMRGAGVAPVLVDTAAVVRKGDSAKPEAPARAGSGQPSPVTPSAAAAAAAEDVTLTVASTGEVGRDAGPPSVLEGKVVEVKTA